METSLVEMTPGLIAIIAVVAVVGFVLVRWGSRHEAASPVDGPDSRARSSTMAGRQEGASDALVNWLLDRALEQTGVNVADDALARQRIVQAAGQAEEDLRTLGSATISLPFLVADARGPRHFDVQVRQKPDSTFEQER